MGVPHHLSRFRNRLAATALALLCAAAVAMPDAGVSLASQLARGRVKALGVGKCLVAARDLPDPNFGDSVVLLAEYGDGGAMGVIVNRPTDLSIERVLGNLKAAQGRTDTVYFGGPVSTNGLVALIRSTSAVRDSRRVLADVHLITSRESLESVIASGAKSDTLRTYLGYAGWGPGQLERETRAGSWHVVPADGDLIFDPEPEAVWRRLIQSTERFIALRLYGVVA